MSIDIQSETTCSIAEAAKRFPGRPHVATVWRYVHHGVHGQRLETIKVGGKRFTSHEAIERFIERVNRGRRRPGDPRPLGQAAGAGHRPGRSRIGGRRNLIRVRQV